MPPSMICQERMYLTTDRQKLVGEGNTNAAFLYASPGDEIPHDAAERFKLKDGRLPGSKGGSTPANKELKPGENKGGPGKTEDKAPALTDIKGIGAKTAKALKGVGIKSVAELARVDAESAPSIDDLPPSFDWDAAVKAAAELTAAKDASQ